VIAGWAAGAFSAAGYVLYTLAIWRGRCTPSRLAWLAWAAGYAVFFAASAAQGPLTALWLPGAQLAGTLTAAALLAWRTAGKFSRGEIVSLTCAGAALGLWWLTRSPAVAAAATLAAEGGGMALTVVRAWRGTGREPVAPWALWTVAGLCDFPALGWQAAPVLYVYPALYAVMGATAATAGIRRQRADPHPHVGGQPAPYPRVAPGQAHPAAPLKLCQGDNRVADRGSDEI
jgi:hypothetical protein